MAPSLEIPVTTGGLLVAIACVVAGGPLFAHGLRALRLRRLIASLRAPALAAARDGLVQVEGQVVLESPLFAPLSQRPCAGYKLEVTAMGTRFQGHIIERRAFQLESDTAAAQVHAESGQWAMPITLERQVAAGEPLSERLAALFDCSAELRWLRGCGLPLQITERAIEAGTYAHVVGVVHHVEAETLVGEDLLTLQATGTDGAVHASTPQRPRAQLVIGSDDPLELVMVSDRAQEPQRLSPPAWSTTGTLLGPAVSMAGLLYLAHAAETLLAGRW